MEQKPSQVTERFWLYANNPMDKRSVHPNLTGKFMLFVDKDNLDDTWKIVKKATEDGLFSYNSICSTAKENPNAVDDKGLICIYTADYNDMEEINRVEKNIRKIFKNMGTIYYKADIQTMTDKTGPDNFTYMYQFDEKSNDENSNDDNSSGQTLLKTFLGITTMVAMGYGMYRFKKYMFD